MKWKKIFLSMVIFLTVFSHVFYARGEILISYNTVWVPNPSFLGGLNTRIRMDRFFLFEWVKLQNQTFYARYNATNYYLNVTAGNNVNLRLYNWFDSFGTAFRVNKACNITFYTGNKGEPVKVNGASYVYNSGSKTLDLTITGSSYVGIHYKTGSTVSVSNPDKKGFFHSQNSPEEYKTIYGFGLIRTGYYQYGFQTRTFCNHTEHDINTIALKLGNDVTFSYNHETHEILHSDPKGYCEIASEWYGENALASWVNYNPNTRYLDVGFNIYFKLIDPNQTIPAYWFPKYQPWLTHQNCTVTVNSETEGSIINEQPAIFYVGLSRLPFIQPVYIAWGIRFFIIGLGGIFTLIFGIFYGSYKIKKGDIAEGIAYGLLLTVIAIGLIIVWLWK